MNPTLNASKNNIEINIKNCDQSPGLNARKIWQQLFRCVKAWEWTDLDSFLCDLKIFENHLVDKYQTEFYWVYDPSGYTDVSNTPYTHKQGVFHITVIYDVKIIIERL